MRQVAIRQALERLTKARDAIPRMEKAECYASFVDPWSDFLLAAAGIYSKLEQGSKVCGTSRGWYGRKKYVRKHDELLSYLHHARDVDEHGIEPTVQHVTELEHTGGVLYSVRMGMDGGGNAVFHTQGDKDAAVRIVKFVTLKTVKDSRYGTVFLPPQRHLNQLLGHEPRAVDVARLGLAYLESLISEATQLPKFP